MLDKLAEEVAPSGYGYSSRGAGSMPREAGWALALLPSTGRVNRRAARRRPRLSPWTQYSKNCRTDSQARQHAARISCTVRGSCAGRRPWGSAIGLWLGPLVRKVEDVDHSRGDHHRCGKPGNEVLKPGILRTRSHAFSTEPLRDERATNDLPILSDSWRLLTPGRRLFPLLRFWSKEPRARLGLFGPLRRRRTRRSAPFFCAQQPPNLASGPCPSGQTSIRS
jgi:hypothetical protein